MSEDDAQMVFRKLRWADTDGEPVCPECGCVEHYDLKSRPVWKCKGCSKQFSVTSGTVFHGRKLQVRDILAAIAIFINGAKGYSALQLSRDLCVDYKTAFVLLHKVRESIAIAQLQGTLSGEVEVDGAYFGGYVKPANQRKARKDRRRKIHQSGKRQSVVVMRERKGRTLTYVAGSEAEGVQAVAQRVEAGTTVHADEASHWDKLAARFPIKRINHKFAYSEDDANTNQAESFFSRLRRAEIGIHHRIAGRYLHAYAAEIAWREDFRRAPNGTQFLMATGATAISCKSASWCGYWQRRRISY